MKEELKQEMLRKAVEGKLSCAVARKIAEELNIPFRDVGDAADQLGIRINNCQLGCF
jgi:LAO/AO transport system kinase